MTTESTEARRLSIAALLWTEYEHRHTHCWTMIFQLTAAIVFLSGVPYIDQGTTKLLGKWIMLAPVLSIFLAGSGMLVMYRELSVFKKVKDEFHRLQSAITSIKHEEKGTFTGYLLSYVWCLVFCSTFSAWISFCIWLPTLLPEDEPQELCWPTGLASVIVCGLTLYLWRLLRRDSLTKTA